MAEVASAYVTLMPSFRGGARAIASELNGPLATAGREGGQKFGHGVERGGKSTFASAGTKLGGAFAAAFAAVGIGQLVGSLTRAVTGFVGESIGLASDLNETMNRSTQVFGDNAAAIDEWSDTAARSLGLSKQAAVEAASNFGNMFTQLGFAADEATKLSTQVVQMSADLGSFNNLPTEDVAQRISAAFRGEYDSLQLLIPNINAARVEKEALAATGKENAKQLTAQEKATAVLAIVNKDGAAAMGDFARTADEFANSQKTAKAEVEDLKTQIGQALLPIAKDAMSFFLAEGVPALQKLADWFTKNQDEIRTFAIVMADATLTATECFLRMVEAGANMYASMVGFFRDLVDVTFRFAESVLGAAEEAFGWVPGLGDKLAGAREDLGEFRTKATAVLTATELTARGLANAVGGAADAVAGLRDEIRKLDNKDVYVRVHQEVLGNGRVRVSRGPEFRASGGPVEAGRPYIVGEFEPELYIPDRPGTILNGAQIRAALGDSRGGAGVVQNIYPAARQSEYEIGRVAADQLSWAGRL